MICEFICYLLPPPPPPLEKKTIWSLLILYEWCLHEWCYFLKDIIFIYMYHNTFYWLYTKGHISFDNCKHLFSRKNKWAPGLKVGSSTKIFSYKNASLFFFECNNSWATYFISNFFFKHQLPFIKFLWTILVIVQLKKLCKLLDTHVFILTAIHMRYTKKTWFECLMYLYGRDKIA